MKFKRPLQLHSKNKYKEFATFTNKIVVIIKINV